MKMNAHRLVMVLLLGYCISIVFAQQTNVGIDWILVEGGPSGDFKISATEVTFDQYDAFCLAAGANKPADEGWGRGTRPVINVNVADAAAFCQWLSKKTGTTVRLPEESEWEFAARGGKKSKKYEYSGSSLIGEAAWYKGNSGNKTHQAGTKKANELGIYDMTGNVWEWCGTAGAIRGGSWNSGGGHARISYRYDSNTGNRDSFIGFRIVQK